MKSYFLAAILLATFLGGCINENGGGANMTKEVNFTTDDGVTIFGTLYQPTSPNTKAVILLHMLRTDRSYWKDFANTLRDKGYTILAIDMRGHGQSTGKSGSRISWQTMTEKDFNDMVLDVKAAKTFLTKQGISGSKIAIMGASIGANTALNYAAADKQIAAVALLSPGLDYHGVKTEGTIKSYIGPIFIAASKEDEPAASSSQRLYELANEPKQIKMYNNAGHGTRIFDKTDLKDVLVKWLIEKF
jgi:dienelactone hydrolase